MSATVSAVILENTLRAGDDPATATLSAVVQHSSIFVQDLLSEVDTEFEAEMTITLRPKCDKIINGLQMNWRSFLADNIPSFNNMNLRLMMNKKKEDGGVAPKSTPAALVSNGVAVQAASATLSMTMPTARTVPAAAAASNAVTYANGRDVSRPSNASSAPPSLPRPAGIASSQSTSASKATSSSTVPAALMMFVPDASTSSVHIAPPATSASQQTRPAPTLPKAVMDKINTEYIVRGGHAFAKPGGSHHRDNFCSMCTSLEHTYETHYKLEKGTVRCAYGDAKCVNGNKCYHAHTNAQRNRAKDALAAPEFKYNQENMCYVPMTDANNPGYFIYFGCGSTTHTYKNCKAASQ
jgi:hypothetical protein